ncbi:MAG: multifunctional oxoglutarate decarboxylase/oxoglutarate dehydrogenase thiamine pyrophosphate-binding subunit/dihydrolipoyllysine-residue succinyltransferase subunit [Actinobacteria bacterium]|uniref:oxoglutarate dehydrogenase (succinyl-transferring) n=1 Tax=freshwater metagenome TaxID=449393 RepID=A0A6J6HSP2_9ZZZZ|nr:multifunctional oxoglutarate decarboxylase/oxoglutarate dehydrogenase thiamine pyrophosphate-binding subunit/dihydrolipoyllysine-residue succinyltransferase subunit [Actinomycetota bacterium]
MTAESPLDAFGPNQWLVDEMYQSYLRDKESVNPAWWDFFADYSPTDSTSPAVASTPAATPAVPAPAQPAAPAPVATPAVPQPAPTAPAPAAASAPATDVNENTDVLRGPAARVVTNMDASLSVPTATSVRAVPAKLLIENRLIINQQLARGRGGKISFTHLIGYAIVRALKTIPEMNYSFTTVDGKPAVQKNQSINFGLAIDIAKPDGSRQLLVPSVKFSDQMDFAQFWAAYEDVVRRARANKLTVDDFAGTTITLTNPGTIGTVHSVPRLMQGQGTIIGVGAMEYPAEYQGASIETLARLAIGKIMTMTSTYDHRIIQGAQSGDFLRVVHSLLLGEDNFYDDVFASLNIPYQPIRWEVDVVASHEDDINKTARVQELIHAYRVRGHLMADTNPLEYEQRKFVDLDLAAHGLTVWDLDREFATGGFGGVPIATLRDILALLRDSYCRTIGVEYMQIQDPEQRRWLQARLERPHAKPDHAEQLRILGRLNAGEAFETYLQTKYVGQKRFSLEGGESLIPLLDAVLSAAAESGLQEVCIGMPHRGRLNVLAAIAGKSYSQIFREFDGSVMPGSVQGSGDVKYHLGTEGTFTADSGATCGVYLAANPSHLEAVNPVLQGIVRAKQDMMSKEDGPFNILPLLMHGDAAFAGQGVVAETLNLSQLRGYRTGGTVHVIVNNQVGFTTAPEHSRSSVYATDVARMIQAPIFHVNGDDPEAVVYAARLAFEFRQEFHKDVVVDMLCYRLRGHNEADDPSLTQPTMYERIDTMRSVRKRYTEGLVGRGDITVEEAEQALKEFQTLLESAHTEVQEAKAQPIEAATPAPVQSSEIVDTAISTDQINAVINTQINLPDGFHVHPRLAPQLQRRAQMVQDDTIDWATAEMLAMGSLLAEGRSVRLAGQDSRRGTFGQRHAVIMDKLDGHAYKPLKQLYSNGSRLYAYDSLLSEYAALGFEYGYAVARPEALVMWEAQFGDFVNGAQTIIDEFIASGEQKWGQRSSVALLLPHGLEGQGPDHSSARIERFLQLCAQDNMTVAMPSTPASYFHLLRDHVLSERVRPLIVATPKSMLRNKAATSATSDFTDSRFQPIIEDSTVDTQRVRKVILCSGKVTHDLLAHRATLGDDAKTTAIIRVEQLYPLPVVDIARAISQFPRDVEVLWVQEEPANQGAWPFVGLNLGPALARSVRLVSRDAASAPASGSHSVHDGEQKELVAQAFS